MFNLVDVAMAQSAAPAAGPSWFELLAMPAGFLAIMYLFIIRPQQKKLKEHSNLLTNLKTGEEVYTSGGIIGKVKSVADGFVTLDINGTNSIKILKNNIAGKTQVAAAKPAAAKK